MTFTTPPTARPFSGPAMLQHLEFLDRLVGEVLEQTADDVVFVVAASTLTST